VGWATEPVTLTFTAADDLSGIYRTFYSTNGSLPTSSYTRPLVLRDGRYNITYYSQDNAGNKEEIHTYPEPLLIDTSKPSRPSVRDEGRTTVVNTYLYAYWSCSDTVSGIAEYQYQIRQDSIKGDLIRDWTSTGTESRVLAEGLSLDSGKRYYFLVRARNGAGLWSDTGYSDGIMVSSY
jgi:hypothetical protein